MTRLNDLIPNTRPPQSTLVQSTLKSVLDLTTASLAVDIKPDISDSLNESYREFFEKYYVKPDESGEFNHGQINQNLSNIEADILNFFLTSDSQTKPYLFIDHAGRGKTTILKYLAYYLFNNEDTLKNQILPIYISLRSHETIISSFSKVSDLHSFFRMLIKENSFKVIYDHFLNNTNSILSWINKFYHSPLQGLYPEQRIIELSEDPDRYVEELADSNPQRLIDLFFGMLCYYSFNNRTVVLLLDDADNFPIDVQRALLDFSKISIPSGLKTLVALRVSTWKTLESDRRDYEPYISLQKINWSLSTLTDLLLKRINNAYESITIRAESYKMDATKESVIKAFINLLSNDFTTDFLVKTSNYNLHSLMRKISLIPRSWHFEDKYLLRELLRSYTKLPNHGVPLWVTFNILLGTYNGTFQSNDDTARCGLINCLCTRDDKHEPYTFFARIHMLIRLRNCTDEGKCIRISELRDEYRQIFGENLSFSRVIRRTLYRLVQAGLINTLSCRRYQSTYEVNEHIETDAVYITDAGLYYLNWLVFRIDYLHFMKDDIDWPENFDITDLTHVSVGLSRVRRHKTTFRALGYLMELELNMLDEIQRQLNQPGDSRIAKLYVSNFSAKMISKGKNDILITKHMLNEYLDYLRYSPSYAEYSAKLKIEIDSIYMLLNNYNDVRKAFQ